MSLWLTAQVNFALAATPNQEIQAQIKFFFTAAHQHQYKKIYYALSHSLRQEFTLEDFKTYIQQIRSAQLLSWKLFEADNHLARVQVNAKLQVKHQGKLYEAVYQGTVTLIKQNRDWLVDGCYLEPVSQKVLQNIDF